MGGMTAEITAALSAVKSAGKLARGLVDLMRSADRQQILIEFNEQLLNAQAALFDANAKYEELAQIKSDLERQLMEKENWTREAARYELKELVPGVFVYAVKPGMEAGGPDHYLCPHCFEKEQRAIMSLPGPGWTKYVCHQCKYEAVFQSATIVSVPMARHRRGLDG